MKNFNFKLTTVFVLALQLICCKDLSPSKYVLNLPKPPEKWVSLLGKPCWRLEWFAPNGEKQAADFQSTGNLEVELPVTWANPVIAWPYWPEHNLGPGLFMPAGAIIPFNIEKNTLQLSWERGPDVIFYMELALACANEQKPSKTPANFDWPRFRELFHDETLNKDVREDPWLVNWRQVAEKTVSANFDKRRLVPEKTESMHIPVPTGLWYGTSPFAKPLLFENDADVAFNARPGINLWVSMDGILRVNGKTWVFSKMRD
ncbi:hypothetical protein [Treponema sp. R80B11-R83G3]